MESRAETLPEIIAVVGPTASGKSVVGMALAKQLGGEIVSCDSQDVYRRLDVGTAKPTQNDRAQIAHHLIDVCEPTEQMSAGDYVRLADEAILDIRSRQKLPVIVGGTGLWLRALIFGMIDVPETSADIRGPLEAKLQEAGGKVALFEQLKAIDPDAAAKIDKNNGVRIVRALEMFLLTGKRPSELWATHAFQKPRYSARVFAINPPREALYERINNRARAMFEHDGLLEEAKALVRDGLEHASAVTRAIGYPQAIALARGQISFEQAIEETAKFSRRYAKRQWTWFRAEKSVEWLEATEPMAAVEEILQRLQFEPQRPVKHQ